MESPTEWSFLVGVRRRLSGKDAGSVRSWTLRVRPRTKHDRRPACVHETSLYSGGWLNKKGGRRPGQAGGPPTVTSESQAGDAASGSVPLGVRGQGRRYPT